MPTAQETLQSLLADWGKSPDDPHGMEPGEQIRSYLTLHMPVSQRLQRAQRGAQRYEADKAAEMTGLQKWLRSQRKGQLDTQPPTMNADVLYALQQHRDMADMLSALMEALSDQRGSMPSNEYRLLQNTVQNQIGGLNRRDQGLQAQSMQAVRDALRHYQGGREI